VAAVNKSETKRPTGLETGWPFSCGALSMFDSLEVKVLFLGFSFSNNKEPKRRIAPKALLRCKQKIRELTRRTRGISLEQMMKELTAYFTRLEELLRLLSDTLTAKSSG
jgi:hypothetical protein